jgi:hypothetical protein
VGRTAEDSRRRERHLLRLFPYLADEADAFARQRVDEALALAIVVDRGTRRVDARADSETIRPPQADER